MQRTVSICHVSWFRQKRLIWSVLSMLLWSWMPAMSWAQQPTATINTLSGTVLVNGQEQGQGVVMSVGDVIETQADATVVLTLSDGSLLELGENTKLDLAVLSQTTTGARISKVKLLWGRIRAALSPDHQHEESSFDIETPNALVGVKFSQPDVEVSYDPAKQETIGIAHTVELMARNLLTDEEKLVKVGSTVIIVGATIKIVAGVAVATGAVSVGTTGTGTTTTAAGTSTASTASGIGTGTMIAIGAGAAAAVGGGIALAATLQEESPSDEVSFTGTFVLEMFPSGGLDYLYEIFTLVQTDASVTGTFSVTSRFYQCETSVISNLPVTGSVNGRELSFTLPFEEQCAPCNRWDINSWCTRIEGGSYTAVLINTPAGEAMALKVVNTPCITPGCVPVVDQLHNRQ